MSPYWPEHEAGRLPSAQESHADGGVHENEQGVDEQPHRAPDRGQSLGANAVVATRFTTSMMMGGAAELLAVGTAVVVDD